LTEKGIPKSALLVDETGYRTLESIVRARDVFGLSSFIIVSQRFHNERAVFLAARYGIEAIGFNAPDVDAGYGPRVILREYLARCRVFLDLLAVCRPTPVAEDVQPALQD
jgi:SanA protein